MTTFSIIAFETTVICAMLVTSPPTPQVNYPAPYRPVLTCTSSRKTLLMPLVFDFFLLCVCTLNAIKTFNVTDNFNECKFIGFAMYTTCVIWIATICIYFVDIFQVIIFF